MGCAIPDRLDPAIVARLHQRSEAGRWRVTIDRFGVALAESVRKGLREGAADREVERYCDSLHLNDLALACACAAGDDEAWEHFVREVRPTLYRAAAALDGTGGARELADSIYGDLYGLQERDGERRSLFRYFHGRSSLATWLRAVLAQRHVDRVRVTRRLEQLPEDGSTSAALAVQASPPDPDRSRDLRLIRGAFAVALAALAAKDRLRLSCYYARQLTLAETGRVLHEHEATVSRRLAKARSTIRQSVERQLREDGLTEAEVEHAFASVVEDAGSLDLVDVLRKKSTIDRSLSGEVS